MIRPATLAGLSLDALLAAPSWLLMASEPTRIGPGVRDYHKGLHNRTFRGGNYPGSVRRRQARQAARGRESGL